MNLRSESATLLFLGVDQHATELLLRLPGSFELFPLEQEVDGQQTHANYGQQSDEHGPPVLFPKSRLAKQNGASGRELILIQVPSPQFAPVKHVNARTMHHGNFLRW